jgi:hypothetical protein
MLFSTARACTFLAQTAFVDPISRLCVCPCVLDASVRVAPGATTNKVIKKGEDGRDGLRGLGTLGAR